MKRTESIERALRDAAQGDTCKKVGRSIRERRRFLGLSQQTLAFDSGLDVGYISTIERGRTNPSLLILVMIAKALRMPVAELFTDIL